MANYTAEEALQHNIDAMGEPLGRLHYTLTNELVWLNAKWQQYVELYGKKPSRIDLINEAAGLFFRIIQDALWEDTLLHIARLTDPPQTSGKDNLSISRLADPKLIDDNDLLQNIQKLISIAIKKSNFARDWRNRRIAHRDFALAMQEDTNPLEHASRAQIKEALHSIADVLNMISAHYRDSEMHFEAPTHFKGAISLLHIIDLGLRAEQERRNRIGAGEHTPEDFNRRIL